MGSRVPVQHYNLRSANSFIGSSLHDLNTVDSRPADIDGIGDVDRDAVHQDALDNDADSTAVVMEKLVMDRLLKRNNWEVNALIWMGRNVTTLKIVELDSLSCVVIGTIVISGCLGDGKISDGLLRLLKRKTGK